MSRRRPANPREVGQIISELRYSVLPSLEKEFAAAHDYIGGRRDRPSNDQNDYITGGGGPSDPTADIAAEQERNRGKLKEVSEGIDGLLDDARSLAGRLKSVFDVSEEGPLESARIPSIKEAQAHKDAVRNRERQRLEDEKRQLERRVGEINRTLEAS